MIYLLDVNLVIALIDPVHSHHRVAHDWFERTEGRAWATCPIIQNGVIRILSQPTYGNAFATPSIAAQYLTKICDHPTYNFWSDDLSLLTSEIVELSKLMTPRQVTDTYLLGLATTRSGKLATLDRRLNPSAIRDGLNSLEIVA